jgi:hypothetical protein
MVTMACLSIADVAGFIAVCASIGGSRPEDDIFTQALCLFGFLLFVSSDRCENKASLTISVRDAFYAVAFTHLNSYLT